MKDLELHSLLRRQLRRCFPGGQEIPNNIQAFLAEVDKAYHDFDSDREMLERSLELSSQELVHANSEMRALFSAIPDILLRVGIDGRVISSKAGTHTDLQLPPGEWKGRLLTELVPPAAAGRIRCAHDEAMNEGRQVSLEYDLYWNEGRHVCEARLIPTPDKEVIAIIRDITERKMTEEALGRAEEKYRTIFENAIDGIFRMTPAGRFVEANPACAAILGYGTPTDLVSHICEAQTQIFSEPKQFVRLVRQLDDEGQVQSFEAQLKCADERVIMASITAWRVAPGGGTEHYFEGIIEDVTERKRLEEQFLQSQKMDAFGQLAGGVAHDFNNMLTVILGNLGIIEASDYSVDEKRLAMEELSKAAERTRQLTRQLLTFSRRRPVHMKDLDLNDVVANMTRMLHRLIGEHIVLETCFVPGGAPVCADIGLMEQAVMNLVVNARDAMPKGGVLRLQTECATVDPATAATHAGATSGEVVRLHVVDTGSGISAEHLPHIFEPFFTTKEVGKGTGLGLATVFGIVEQHHGWVDVQSVVGVGTTVTLTFPRRSGQQQLPSSELGSRLPGKLERGSENIMLVEDEADVRALLRRLLERNGYHVIEAENGVKALDIWRHENLRIDLLITDMVMPGGVSGRELAEFFRKDVPDLKVIYCSGYSDEILGKDSWLRGEDAFMEKPLDLIPFLERVRRFLDAPAKE